MPDNLQKILDLQARRQRESFGLDLTNMSQEDRIEFIRWNVLALEAELHEALDEIGWKPWATSRHINREAFLGELVDAQHFLNNLYLAVGADASEVTYRYLEKSAINRDRQAGQYDGVSTKCPICRRALDDPAVTCSAVVGCTRDSVKGVIIQWGALS